MLALAVARECGVTLRGRRRGIAAMPQPQMRVAWEQVGNGDADQRRLQREPGLDARGDRAAPGTGSRTAEGNRPRYDARARCGVASSARRHRGSRVGIGRGHRRGNRRVRAALETQNERERVITAPDVEELWPQLEARLAARRDHPAQSVARRAARASRSTSNHLGHRIVLNYLFIPFVGSAALRVSSTVPLHHLPRGGRGGDGDFC